MVSYLLIGFWYTRPTAIFATLKAFLVNRIGDFGFVLGIAAVLAIHRLARLRARCSRTPRQLGARADSRDARTIAWPAITFTCICLFIGAMGKSAQVPLHVWLPDSMEGPTPISALIHAATMVTAGIFMVARMSPLFELSETALSFVLIIGATTAFFMGLLGIVNNDIKRVIAYSTLSQLGYMTVALGVSAYGAGIFHLMTHAFFKALLFLAAGSVIIAMHHEQDMRKMGGLRKYLPITYWTFLVGALALIGFPGSSGFFSKDLLIDAVHASHRSDRGYAYFCVLAGVFVTALYTFRMFFMTFHGEERMDQQTQRSFAREPVGGDGAADPAGDSRRRVIGWLTVQPVLFGGYFDGAIQVLPAHDVLGRGRRGIPRPGAFCASCIRRAAAVARRRRCARGVAVLSEVARAGRMRPSAASSGCTRSWSTSTASTGSTSTSSCRWRAGSGSGLWHGGDEAVIDGALVNGSARLVGWLGSVMRYAQSGYLYHYAFAMILGLASLLLWLIWRP